jgi:Cys-tRNA synthase (O-phospho-L-seryl-tRNA:Cys-tRNA synthase)
MEREEAELRALNQEEASLRAANKRITTMAEELRKAELVRDRLEGLDRLMGSYPEGHDMRERLEALHVDQALKGVDEGIRRMTDALIYPRGT